MRSSKRFVSALTPANPSGDADRLPQAPEIIEPRPPAHWPHAGEIHVEKLSIRYAPELPDVLHELNFSVLPGQKVGIVGATGASLDSSPVALLTQVVEQGAESRRSRSASSASSKLGLVESSSTDSTSPRSASRTCAPALPSSRRYISARTVQVLHLIIYTGPHHPLRNAPRNARHLLRVRGRRDLLGPAKGAPHQARGGHRAGRRGRREPVAVLQSRLAGLRGSEFLSSWFWAGRT